MHIRKMHMPNFSKIYIIAQLVDYLPFYTIFHYKLSKNISKAVSIIQ